MLVRGLAGSKAHWGTESQVSPCVDWRLFVAVFLWHSPSLFSWVTVHQEDHLIESMAPEKPWIEESREALGALIGVIVMLVHMRFAKRIAAS